jgi:AraC family transcriptional regulator
MNTSTAATIDVVDIKGKFTVEGGKRPPLAAENEQHALHASCAVMRVTYLARVPADRQEQVFRDIRILLPGEEAGLHVAHSNAGSRSAIAYLSGHHLSIVPAGRPHSIWCERQSDLVALSLDPAFFQRKAAEALVSSPPALLERHGAADPFLREMGHMLRAEFQRRRIPGSTFLQFLAGVIAVHLAKNHSVATPPHLDRVWLPPHKLNRVQAFVKEHFAEPIKVEHMAAQIGMSAFHFSRMFKRATGRTPYLCIIMQRIERAKELLSDTDVPLAEVAARVGFQTQSHFTSVFRKFAGVTPQVFRLNAIDLSACV